MSVSAAISSDRHNVVECRFIYAYMFLNDDGTDDSNNDDDNGNDDDDSEVALGTTLSEYLHEYKC